MRIKPSTLFVALALATASGSATENLPWVYETSSHPADVFSETPPSQPAISGTEYDFGDSAALDGFNSFWREIFQIDELSVIVYRGMSILIR